MLWLYLNINSIDSREDLYRKPTPPSCNQIGYVYLSFAKTLKTIIDNLKPTQNSYTPKQTPPIKGTSKRHFRSMMIVVYNGFGLVPTLWTLGLFPKGALASKVLVLHPLL